MVSSLARLRVSVASDNHPLSHSILALAMHARLLRDDLVSSLDQLAIPPPLSDLGNSGTTGRSAGKELQPSLAANGCMLSSPEFHLSETLD